MGHRCPCSVLLRTGFASRPVTRPLVGSYPTVSPLPVLSEPSAVCFLLHFPSGHPAWVLPSVLPCGVRTFLDILIRCRGRPAGSQPFNSNVVVGPQVEKPTR